MACAAAHESYDRRGLPRAKVDPGGGKRASADAPLPAYRFAEVTDVVGPYVGRDGARSLAAWAEASGGGRALFAAPIDEKGVPGVPQRVGNLAAGLDLMLVRGLGAASGKLAGRPRFALITTRRSDGATARDEKTYVELTAIDERGAASWGPTVVAERPGRVLWLGFVAAGADPLLLWAEQPSGAKPGEPASLQALVVAPDAKPSAPQLVAAKACAWQAASVGAQAALASVRPSGDKCLTGGVTLDLLAASGKVEKSVNLAGRAALDLDLVGGPDAFVLAWSDHERIEPRVVTAVVDARGALRAPAGAATAALGEQAVVALVPGSSPAAPAFLVWENVDERPDGARFFEVSALDAQGRAGAHARLLYGRADGGAPELAAYAGGVAALTLAPACGVDQDCDTDLAVPTFVAFDGSLNVKTSEPLVLAELGGRAADLGWGLTCSDAGCFALAAPSRSPAALFTVPLPLRQNQYRAAAERTPASAKPRVVGADVVLRAKSPLSRIALGEQADRSLLGYVTDFDPTTPWQKLTRPAEDGRFEPLRARIGLRAFASDGSRAPLADEQNISLRAHSLGGLTLLAGASGAKESLALWTGLDKGEPQVFLTLVGADGKRTQQRMLTHKSGDASDVAGLTLDGGYLVAWIDERHRDAEVYAVRVSRALEKAGPEQRITSADGGAADLVLTRVGGKPYAIWADARAGEQPGWADIYGAFLRPSDAAREGAEQRLSSTLPHSFAPRVGSLGGAPVLAWLEDAADDAPASVRLATLSDAGEISGSVEVVPIAGAAPRALGLECGADECRVAVVAEADGRGELYGFAWRPGAAQPPVTRLMGLAAPSAASVAPLLRGNWLYVADQRDGQGLVRRLELEW